MRLLYVVPNLRRIGGVSRSIGRMVDSLREEGHEVRVLAPDPWDGVDPNPQQEARGSFLGTTMQHWTDCVLEEIERWPPDLLVGYYGGKGGFAAVAAARLTGLPAVVCLRGNDVNLDFFGTMNSHLVSFAIAHADAVTVMSNEMRHKVARWFGADSTYIPNSVDTDLYRPNPEGAARLRQEWEIGDGPVVGLFGEFKPAKGLNVLAGLGETLAGATTLLVGEVRMESRRDVPSWVRAIPYISDRETLCAAYSLCDLVLQPSKHEGMPNTVLEAMACERVVVASPAGGLSDLIRDGETGFLARREEWPRIVRHLLAEPRPEVGVAARRAVPTPADERRAFRAVFEEVLARHQTAGAAGAGY
jgi:glycosyltransferase involved in cell wall biosynthesis